MGMGEKLGQVVCRADRTETVRAEPELTRPSDQPPLDRDLLVRRCLGRLELAERLLASFESCFPQDLSRIEESLRQNDTEQLSRLVHQAKGATANISAPELHQNVSQLEQAVKAEQRDVAKSCLAEVHRAWNRFQAYKASISSLRPSPTL